VLKQADDGFGFRWVMWHFRRQRMGSRRKNLRLCFGS
jgi:hypothetical protein